MPFISVPPTHWTHNLFSVVLHRILVRLLHITRAFIELRDARVQTLLICIDLQCNKFFDMCLVFHNWSTYRVEDAGSLFGSTSILGHPRETVSQTLFVRHEIGNLYDSTYSYPPQVEQYCDQHCGSQGVGCTARQTPIFGRALIHPKQTTPKPQNLHTHTRVLV